MRFTALSPARLVAELSHWILRTAAARRDRVSNGAGDTGDAMVIGFDGAAEIGATGLADDVAESLRSAGRPIIRASTSWWWRPSALRLEFGREDEDMLLSGWVDAEAIRRELIDPVVAGGLPYITRLRDPESDRSIRQQPQTALPGSVLLLDGPFLSCAALPLDAMVAFGVRRGTLERALAADRQWWVPAFERYEREYRVAAPADVVISYDHTSTPAAAGLDAAR